MITTWYAGLEPEEKQRVIDDYVSSVTLRLRLSKLLADKIETGRAHNASKDRYLNASWPYQQADAIGYERALYEVISLISSE